MGGMNIGGDELDKFGTMAAIGAATGGLGLMGGAGAVAGPGLTTASLSGAGAAGMGTGLGAAGAGTAAGMGGAGLTPAMLGAGGMGGMAPSALGASAMGGPGLTMANSAAGMGGVGTFNPAMLGSAPDPSMLSQISNGMSMANMGKNLLSASQQQPMPQQQPMQMQQWQPNVVQPKMY